MQELLKDVVKLVPEEEFSITVDDDATLNYENQRWLYLICLPLMWILTAWVFLKKKALYVLHSQPRTNTLFFDGLSIYCRQLKEGAGSWRALDVVYNYVFGRKDGVTGKVSDFWLGMINGQAVRNRLKLVKQKLIEAIIEVAKEKDQVRLLSIASGSAPAVIDAVKNLPNVNIQVVLLDIDPSAIAHTAKLLAKEGIEDKFTLVEGSIHNHLQAIAEENKPQIIEMVGFLDYRPHAKAVYLIKNIYDLLPSDGIFITANICPNPEQQFLKWVMDWDMIYRNVETLANIITEGGFPPNCFKIIQEPLQLHAVAFCRKN